MLFFDFLIAFVARIWYYFMRRGLRRKPALIQMTLLTASLDVLTSFVLSILFFFIGGLYLMLFAITACHVAYLIEYIYGVYRFRFTRGTGLPHSQLRLLFIVNFMLCTIFAILLMFDYFTILNISISLSAAISCVIYVGEMLPDGRLRRKKIRRQL